MVQTSLENELYRKEFNSVNYIDTLGSVTLTKTNIIDLTTVFSTTEANGALVEMGLFGGVGALGAGGGIRVNAKHFPVINKRHDSTLTILWELTF